MIVGVIQGNGPTSGSSPSLSQLSDTVQINNFLLSNAGKTINIFPSAVGYYAPNFLETGEPISIPAGTTLQACGKVTIRSNNPTRPVFHLAGDGAGVVGEFVLTATYTRPVFDAEPGDWTDWATTWNAANPDNQIAGWLDETFEDAWNTAFPHSLLQNLGPLSKPNRASAVTSYDASNILIDGLNITGFHTGVCLQGMDDEAANATQTASIQTYGNIVRNITLAGFDFGILAKKQRNFRLDNIVTEDTGHRVNHGQPHLIYLSNSTDVFEESWNVDVGTVTAYNYEGGSVFKARGCKNLTWKAINCRSIHSAVAIVEACTGTGGPVLVEDQHLTADADGAGSKFAVNVTNSPGFMFDGVVRIQQRAGQDQMKAWSVENSDGVRFLQGCEVLCARSTDDDYLFRVRSSQDVYSGPTKYTDTNARGTLLFTMSDSQEEGGNASNCVLELVQVTGTTKLAEFVGLSSDNQVWVDPTKVDLWDADLALVDNGLGGGNALIDPRATVRKVKEVSTSLDLSLKASATLTIERDGPDPLDEDALPAPKMFSNNDTVEIGSTTFTWKTTLTGALNEVLLPGATIVASYPLMTADYGYLQLAFLNAAVMGTTYKGAGAGQIYDADNIANTEVESEWGGNQFNVRALTAGTGGNSIALDATMTGGGADWNGATLTGGGGVDDGLVNQTLAVTTGASALTMTLPSVAPAGTFIEFVKVDAGAGTVNCGGLATLDSENDRATVIYESGEWRVSFPVVDMTAINAAVAAAELARDEAEAMATDRVFADDTAALAALSVGDYYRVVSADSTEIYELHKIIAGPAASDTGKRFSDNSAWSANFDTGQDATGLLAIGDGNGFQKTFLELDALDWANVRIEETATGFLITDKETGDEVLEYDNTSGEAILLGATITTDATLTIAVGLIDENGFIVDLASSSDTTTTTDPTPEPAPVTVEPIYGDELFAFTDSPVQLYADGLLDGRSATRPDAMISWASWPYDGQGSQAVLIDPARCGATSVLSVRRLTSDIDKRREIAVTNRFASADGAATAGNVAIIGDSITNRRLPELVDDILTSRGYVPTWIGTVPCSADETTSAGGGPLAEGRESRAFADYIYSVVDGEVTVMDDTPTETTNYNAGSKSYKVARIPMLRPELGGDDPAVVRNGYVFDYDRYLTRFGLADPKVVVCLLGTNDINETTPASSLSRIIDGITVMHTQIRAALPTAHIVFGFPGAGRTAAYDTQWADERAACIKGFVETIRDIRTTDTLTHYLAAHAHMSQETGWEIGDGTATADAATGITLADVTDPVHPKGFTRLQLAEQVAAAIAWCLEN